MLSPRRRSVCGEIELSPALVNLNRIAAAHGQVGLGIAFEIAKVAAHAGAAGGVARHAHGLVSSGPNVKRNQTPAHRIRLAKEQLDRFDGFDRGNHTGSGAEDAHCIASFFSARACGLRAVIVSRWPLRWAAGFENAGEACRVAGTHGERHAVARNHGGINPRDIQVDRSVVQQKSRFKVVGAVENERKTMQQFFRVFRSEVGDDSFDGDAGIDGAQAAFGCDGFRQRFEGVGFLK